MQTRCRQASVQKANPLFRRPQEVTRDMDKKQGPWSRREMIERLERQDEFDVAVIGAGATGLGVALDAASRGMSVLIVDGQDWASGHASRSSKHIGSDIRRLVCPARWDRVREELYERRLLLQNAPSLVRAQNYVIPCRSKIGMTMRASSLALYSLFSSGGRGTRPVSMQGRVNALGMLPGIERKGLAGAVTFTDAVCDDAGLALALLSGAVEYGAVALNRMRMIDAEADGRRVTSVVLQDAENGRKRKVRVRTVFNCAGVWADDVRRMVDVTCGNIVKIVRRSYIVVDKTFMPTGNALYLPRGCGGRSPLTIVPWQGRLLIGATAVDQGQAPIDPQPTEDEVRLLMASANRLLSRKIRREDVRARYAGLQAEVGVRGLDGGRGFAVVPEFNNMFTVVGGSMTLYRAKAEAAIDAAIARHLLPKYGCMTRSMRLGGNSQMAMEELQKRLLAGEAPAAEAIMQLNGFVSRHFAETGARCADDILWRRLRLGELDEARAEMLKPVVSEQLAALKAQE